MVLIAEFVSTKADRLKQVREAFGYKSKPFAELLGEYVPNYYGFEKGERPIGKHKSIEIIERINSIPNEIRKGRKVDSDWWETGEGEMFINGIHIENSQNRTTKIKGDQNIVGDQNEVKKTISPADYNSLLTELETLRQKVQDRDILIQAKDDIIELLKKSKNM